MATVVEDLRPSQTASPSGADYSRFSSEELDRCSDQLHGIHTAALAELFAIVRERAKRDDFTNDGARDAAGWLQLRFGLPYPTAAGWAETALALGNLPHLNESFSSGRLSFDKVAVAVEIATPETDAQVAEEAPRITVTALRMIARRRREATPRDEKEARANRSAHGRWNSKGTMWRLIADLPAEQGARLSAALDRTAKQLPYYDQDGRPTSLTQRRADALVALAGVQISEDADQDRATIMVHVDLDTLRTGLGTAWTEEGALLSAETVNKLLCDARLKALVEDADGKPLGVGRTMRNAPRWMRHALKVRDKTCSFPGCDCTQFLVPHHVQHWQHDGPTDPENLPLLCPAHHGLVHSNGWRVEGSPSEGLIFIGPKGTVRSGPPGLDYDVKKWLWEDLYNPRPGELFDSS